MDSFWTAYGIMIALLVSFVLIVAISFNAGKTDGYIEGQIDCQAGKVKKYEKVYENIRYKEVE